MLMPGCVSGAGRFIYNIPPSLRCLPSWHIWWLRAHCLHPVSGKIFFRWLFTVWKAEVSFGSYFFGCFSPGLSLFRMLRSAVVSKIIFDGRMSGEEEPLPASSRLLT